MSPPSSIFGFVVYPLLIAFFSSTPVRKYFSAMKKPQIVAFSTALVHGDPAGQHAETLRAPIWKVTNATASFVLPLGATINMSGNAICYGLVAIFFAQVYNIDLSSWEPGQRSSSPPPWCHRSGRRAGPELLGGRRAAGRRIPIEGLPLLFALDRLFDA